MFRQRVVVALAVVAGWVALGAGASGEIPPASAQSEETVADTPATPVGFLKRALFTSNVVDREPVDDVDSLATDSTRVFFFTEIVGMEGRTVTHRWVYKDETRAEVQFSIGGPRWRVFSSKNLVAEWTGRWSVEIVDDVGSTLGENGFVYYSHP